MYHKQIFINKQINNEQKKMMAAAWNSKVASETYTSAWAKIEVEI